MSTSDKICLVHSVDKSKRFRDLCTAIACPIAMAIAASTASAGPLLALSAAKSFNPTIVNIGGVSQMTLSVHNPNRVAISGVQFDDVFPPGMTNAMGNPIVSSTCGGTLVAQPNANEVAVSGVTLPAGGSCSVIVNVVGNFVGIWINHTGTIFAPGIPSGAGAQANLQVTPQ
jgi:uncharacterized repeat protein (TIGR01451 family)